MEIYKNYKISKEIREELEKHSRWNYFFWGCAVGYAFFALMFWLFSSAL